MSSVMGGGLTGWTLGLVDRQRDSVGVTDFIGRVAAPVVAGLIGLPQKSVRGLIISSRIGTGKTLGAQTLAGAFYRFIEFMPRRTPTEAHT